MAAHLVERRWPAVYTGQCVPESWGGVAQAAVFSYHQRGALLVIYPDHFVVAEWRQHRLHVRRQALTEVATVALRGLPRRLHIIRVDGTRSVLRLDRRAATLARDVLLLVLRRPAGRRTP